MLAISEKMVSDHTSVAYAGYNVPGEFFKAVKSATESPSTITQPILDLA